MTWPLILMSAFAALCVAIIALPAALASHFRPASVVLKDFSGSLWHGSAGSVAIDGHNAGAIEWHLNPWPLLRLELAADLHWVKIGFVADGAADMDSHGLALHDVTGGGPIEDLRDLGLVGGWHGAASFKFTELKLAFAAGPAGAATILLQSAVCDLNVSDLGTPQVADGADLGGYAVHAADAVIPADTGATAQITDTGGPLQVLATLHLSADARTGTLSGTVKARPDAAPPLLAQLANLAQLHARDADGAIPVDLEFTL